MSHPLLKPHALKVLVVGAGGREHMLARKLADSPRVARVYCAPGNAGTAEVGVNVAIDALDFDALVAFAIAEHATAVCKECDQKPARVLSRPVPKSSDAVPLADTACTVLDPSRLHACCALVTRPLQP